MRTLWMVSLIALLGLSAAVAQESDILLIDDSGKAGLENSYGPACLAAQRTYRVWNVSEAGAVPTTTISGFSTVFWVSGPNPAPAGIEGGAETLRRHLARGGRAILAGDRLATTLADLMRQELGLKVVRFNGLLDKMSGRLNDTIAQGWSLAMATSGAETAEIAKPRPGEEARKPEIVFWAPDRGVSRLTAARVEGCAAHPFRVTWFGFGLERAANATRASEVLTRAVKWTTPEPAPGPREQRFQSLWKRAEQPAH